MKLLIVTQKVDTEDPNLSFFHRWILEFATQCERVIVICLYKGKYNLPENVEVLSLGKEKGVSRLTYIKNFYKYIISRRNQYDSVFVHMNPEYLVLAGLLFRVMKKKVALWYVHKSVNLKLRIAVFFAHRIFSASEKSFNIKTKKLRVYGHGIDTEAFTCQKEGSHDSLNILSVSRITRSKGLDEIVKAIQVLKEKGKKPKLTIIGGTDTKDDETYDEELKNLVHQQKLEGNVEFLGGIANTEISEYFCDADVFVNASKTGGLDKVLLESLASKTIAIGANPAYRDIFEEYSESLLYAPGKPDILAEKILATVEREDREVVTERLYKKVKEEYGLSRLIRLIIEDYEASR